MAYLADALGCDDFGELCSRNPVKLLAQCFDIIQFHRLLYKSKKVGRAVGTVSPLSEPPFVLLGSDSPHLCAT